MKMHLGVWLVVFCMVMVFPVAKSQFVSAASLEHATEAELDRENHLLKHDIRELQTMQDEMVLTINKIVPLSYKVKEAVERYKLALEFSKGMKIRQEILKETCLTVSKAASEEIENLEKMNNHLKTYIEFIFDCSGFSMRPGVDKQVARRNLIDTLIASDSLFYDSKKIIGDLSPETIERINDSNECVRGVLDNQRFVIGQLDKLMVIPSPSSQ